MDTHTIIALLIVLGILLFSISVTLGITTKLENLYRDIKHSLGRISLTTAVTVSLIVGAVILAVVASM